LYDAPIAKRSIGSDPKSRSDFGFDDLVPRGGFLDLQQLALDGAHARHQPVEFGQKLPFVLPGFFNEILRGAVADAVEGIGQSPVQKPHMMLQIQKLLVKLGLLEHGRDLA
jgi:hypothetical protein